MIVIIIGDGNQSLYNINLEKKIWQFRKILTLKSFARLKVESFHLTAKDQVVFLSCSINVIMIKLDDLKFEKAQRPALQGRKKIAQPIIYLYFEQDAQLSFC